MTKVKIPSTRFASALKLVGVKQGSYSSWASFECPEYKKTYLMRLWDFNKVIPQLKDNWISGEWITGQNSASGYVRPFVPSKAAKRVDPNVYFSKNGYQRLRKSSYKRWDGPATFIIPKGPFEAALKLATIHRKTYSIYVGYTLSRLDAGLLFNVDHELTFLLPSEKFEGIIKQAHLVDQIHAIWNFETKGGGTTVLVCERIL